MIPNEIYRQVIEVLLETSGKGFYEMGCELAISDIPFEYIEEIFENLDGHDFKELKTGYVQTKQDFWFEDRCYNADKNGYWPTENCYGYDNPEMCKVDDCMDCEHFSFCFEKRE